MARRQGGPKTPAGKAKAFQNLKMWKAGESGNKKGRPRRVLTKLEDMIQADFGVDLSKEDKFSILQSMLEMSKADLKIIEEDEESPAFMVMIASSIRQDIDQGDLKSITFLFDRLFGKPDQTNKMELSGANGGPIDNRIIEWRITSKERINGKGRNNGHLSKSKAK